MWVEDPFNKGYNVAKHIGPGSLILFQAEMTRAMSMMREAIPLPDLLSFWKERGRGEGFDAKDDESIASDSME